MTSLITDNLFYVHSCIRKDGASLKQWIALGSLNLELRRKLDYIYAFISITFYASLLVLKGVNEAVGPKYLVAQRSPIIQKLAVHYK